MGTVEWIIVMSVGVLAGLGLGFFLGRLGGRGNTQKLADVEAELNEYRQNVSEHFSQSAEHFQAIGRQYRELYEHMAVGSEKLCVGAPSEGQLKFPRPDEVSKEASEQTDEPETTADADIVEQSSEVDTKAAAGEPDVAESPADESSAAESSSEKISASEPSEKDALSTEAANENESPDLKSGTAESADPDAAKAPVDYVSDDPKDRQYH